MEREQMKEQESSNKNTYLLVQVALAAVSLVMITAGSLYFEKYREECLTNLLVTLILGAVYGKVLKAYVKQWKVILLIHIAAMLMITVGFLLDGFYKPVVFAPVIVGSFLTPEAGLAAAVYYGITAVLYTMETGELLMLYLLAAGIGIYFLKDFFSSDSIPKKGVGVLGLFAVQGLGTILFSFYMYREAEISAAAVGAAMLAVLTGIFSFIVPFLLEEKADTVTGRKTSFSKDQGRRQHTSAFLNNSNEEKKDKKKRRKKMGQSLLLDENSELFQQLKANQELYQHSLSVAKIAEKAAASVDADTTLVRAGAMYHDIGKLVNGEDYVAEGISLCREHHVLDRVIRLVEEHNVNYKIPTSKEAAAVMLADTIVSTMEFNQKKGKETDPELLVEKIFKIRKEKGSLKGCSMTEIELELMEEAMKKEVGVL